MILPSRPATAAELPPGHCSVRARFDDLQSFLDGELADVLGLAAPGGGSQATFLGSFLEVEHEGIDDSSNGVLLKLTLNIDVLGLIHKHFYARFEVRETPNHTVDDVSGEICPYAKVGNLSYQAVGSPLRPCDPDSDDLAECVMVDGTEYFFGGNAYLNRDMVNRALGNQPYCGPEHYTGTGNDTVDNHNPFVCDRLFFESCLEVARWGISDLSSCPSSDIVVVCERKQTLTPVEVAIYAEDFPGPYAVSVGHDFDRWLGISLPGLPFTLQEYLEKSGMVDQHVWRQEDSGVYRLVLYEARCYLQSLLKEHLGKVLSQKFQLPGNDQMSFGDIALLGGGIRISRQNRRIDFLIPSLLHETDGAHNQVEDGQPRFNYDWEPPPVGISFVQPCAQRALVLREDFPSLNPTHPAWESWPLAKPWTVLDSMQRLGLHYLDFPKTVHHILKSDQTALDVRLHVACNQGVDCSQRGGDRDDDGFCDGGPDPDLCPGIPTSANCDWDGDGIGDGTTHLVGRPSSAGRPALAPNCFSNIENVFPGYGDAGEKTRARLINFACGGCDNCGRLSNPGKLKPLSSISMLDLPEAFRSEESVRVYSGTEQPDIDHDWVGDSCDPDRDGDGYRNELDCEPMNYRLGLDLDRDGMCDRPWDADIPAFDWQDCRSTCIENQITYQWPDPGNPDAGIPYVSLYDCYSGCDKGLVRDNCAPSAATMDFWCAQVFELCLPGDSRAETYAQCAPGLLQFCSMEYSNPGGYLAGNIPAWTQPDGDGDGIGDKCDLGAFALELVPKRTPGPSSNFGPGVSFGCHVSGAKYNVKMRTYGGHAEWPVWGTSPSYSPVNRTAFEVGACGCNHDPATGTSPGGLDWRSNCWDEFCPENGSIDRGEEDPSDRKYWNPLSEPSYAASHGIGCHLATSCVSDADNIAQARQANLVYGRRHVFTRDEAVNKVDLSWAWKIAPRAWWPADATTLPVADFRAGESYPQKVPRLVTRVRAVWPNYNTVSGADHPITYAYSRLSDVSYSAATLIDEVQGQCFGEVYLGPPFVLSIIPGQVDFWGNGEAWLPGSGLSLPDAAAYLLGRSQTTGDLIVYRYGRDGFGLDSAQRLTGAPIADIGSVSATVGSVNASFHGLEAGRHLTLFAYQEATFGLCPDPTHCLPSGPARLLVGRLSEGEYVSLSALEALSGQATPTVSGGSVHFDSQGQVLYLLGRATSGDWSLTRLALDDLRWTGALRIPLASADRLLSATMDPVSRRVLLLVASLSEGAAAAPETVMKALWLDPTTLALTEAAPAAPADALRDRPSVRLDPRARKLLVAGGERDDGIASDVWELDLELGAWAPFALLPEPMASPLLDLDPVRQLLWVAEPKPETAGLTLWAYSQAAGAWSELSAPVLPVAPVWPVDDTYVEGRSYTYLYAVEASVPLPGRLLLARLTAEVPWLGLEIRGGGQEALSESAPDELTGDGLAAALCPSGVTCLIEVRPSGGGPERLVPFSLDVQAASLSPAGALPCPTTSRSLALRGGILYLVGAQGILKVQASTLEAVGSIKAPDLNGAQAAALCGSNLCVAKPGVRGLLVVDPSRATSAPILGTTALQHPVEDLAIWGHLAFVAQGQRGVSIINLQRPDQPMAAGTIATGGYVISVAQERGLLAAALRDGTVKLYDVRSAPVGVGSFAAGFKISKLRFVGGRLLLLDQQGKSAEVWSLDDPGSPFYLGSFLERAAALTLGRFQGARLFYLDGHELRVLRVE